MKASSRGLVFKAEDSCQVEELNRGVYFSFNTYLDQ